MFLDPHLLAPPGAVITRFVHVNGDCWALLARKLDRACAERHVIGLPRSTMKSFPVLSGCCGVSRIRECITRHAERALTGRNRGVQV